MTELVTKLTSRIKELEEELLKKEQQLLYYQRRLFGAMSEKRLPEDPNQLKIQFDQESSLTEENNMPSIVQEIQVESHKRRTSKSDKKERAIRIPDCIERRNIVLEPEGVDLSKAVKIGEDVREVLEMTAPSFWVNRLIRPIYKIDNEDKSETQIFQHPAVESFIPKSYAGNSVLTELIIGKYIDHTPVYRQIEIFKRNGIDLHYNTVNNWVHEVASELYPLYELQVNEVLKAKYIQADESTLPVIDKEKSRAVKAYIWLIHDVNNRQVFFHYDQGSRASEVIISLLKDYQGYVQTDGYSGYEIYEKKEGVTLIGCWVHARRRFEKAKNENEKLANIALDYISLLYQIEANMEHKKMSLQQIESERKRLAYPLIKEFEKWMLKQASTVTPASLMGVAINYTFERLNRLSRYITNGQLLMDNNLIENAVRPLALGRKNYMFCNNHQTAKNTALYYTFFGTCKMQGINPAHWFKDVLAKIKDTKTENLHTLLPANWKNQR